MGIPTNPIYVPVRDPRMAEAFEERVSQFREFVPLTETQADFVRTAIVCAYLQGRSAMIEEQFQKLQNQKYRPASL